MRRAKRFLKHLLLKHGIVIYRNPKGRLTGEDPMLDMRTILGTERPVCLDIGANKGQTIEKLKTAFRSPLIFAFEPSANHHDILVGNYSSADVRIFKLALGETESQKTFIHYENDELSSFLPLADSAENPFRNTPIRASETVPVSTVDAFVREQALERIDILKIDTQGYDHHVLRGARQCLQKKMVRCVFLEFNFLSMYAGQADPYETAAMLRQFDITLVDYYEKVRTGDRLGLSWCSALFRLRPSPAAR